MSTYNNYKTLNSTSGVFSFAKIFLYMFIGLLITGGFATLTAYLLTLGISNMGQGGVYLVSFVAFISIIGIIAISTFMNISLLKKGKYSIPLVITYAALIGVAIGCLCVFIPWQLAGASFVVSAGLFLILALFALIFKRSNLNMLAVVSSFLFVGVGFMFFASWLFMLLIPGVAYWIISLYMVVTFAAIMLITIYDVWRINQIVEMGEMSNDMSIYCAITLYSDFINIFVRVLFFMVRIFGSSR